ncbi:unnamed protein product [Durusdinium trenchii]|uniref:Uncharacterized protein n=1 Tax=Durusdinium trenchii TaxID=1381693 RepID=A0ABP0N0Y6_9DINO
MASPWPLNPPLPSSPKPQKRRPSGSSSHLVRRWKSDPAGLSNGEGTRLDSSASSSSVQVQEKETSLSHSLASSGKHLLSVQSGCCEKQVRFQDEVESKCSTQSLTNPEDLQCASLIPAKSIVELASRGTFTGPFDVDFEEFNFLFTSSNFASPPEQRSKDTIMKLQTEPGEARKIRHVNFMPGRDLVLRWRADAMDEKLCDDFSVSTLGSAPDLPADAAAAHARSPIRPKSHLVASKGSKQVRFLLDDHGGVETPTNDRNNGQLIPSQMTLAQFFGPATCWLSGISRRYPRVKTWVACGGSPTGTVCMVKGSWHASETRLNQLSFCDMPMFF